MTLPVPSELTANVGDFIAAANWNSNVRDAVNFLTNPPEFIGYQATGVSVGNAAWSTLAIDTNVIDTYTGHSTTTNNYSYVAPLSGTYEVLVSVNFANNATGRRGASIGVGTTTAPNPSYQQCLMPAGVASSVIVACKQMVTLSAGQAINALCYQDSGAALATVANTSTFQVRWVHA